MPNIVYEATPVSMYALCRKSHQKNILLRAHPDAEENEPPIADGPNQSTTFYQPLQPNRTVLEECTAKHAPAGKSDASG